MKDSGIPWIGMIPEDWEVGKIKNKFKVFSGSTPKSDDPDFWDGEISWITPADYKSIDKYISKGKKTITSLGYNSCGTVMLPKGSLIFSKRAPIGTVVIANNELCTNQGCLGCIPKEETSNLFYYYLFSCFTNAFNTFGFGTTFLEISYSDFCNFKICIPPLAEQEAIAAWLDEKCGEIDELIDVEQKMIDELEAYRQATITEAVTRGLNPDVPMCQTGISWIPEIPKHWKLSNVKFYSTFYNGDRTSRYPQPNELLNEGIPFLTSRNINSNIVDVEIKESKFISKKKYDSLGGAKLKPLDIVYCLRGSIGKCAINKNLSDGTIASSLMVIRPENINHFYLLFYLLSDTVSEQTSIYMNGTCAANLSAENVGNYTLPVPPHTEQRAIADYLDDKCKEIDELIAVKREKIETLKQYRQSIIFEAVTGKLQIS